MTLKAAGVFAALIELSVENNSHPAEFMWQELRRLILRTREEVELRCPNGKLKLFMVSCRRRFFKSERHANNGSNGGQLLCG